MEPSAVRAVHVAGGVYVGSDTASDTITTTYNNKHGGHNNHNLQHQTWRSVHVAGGVYVGSDTASDTITTTYKNRDGGHANYDLQQTWRSQ